ncbi:hypothetical protein [Streptomyces sp. NPDC094149]|uniref:hypothetical protein n=1 Tax=Streptomyces sp. NPDC094149 TaxID=3155079 RepID=UPI0033299C6E
MRLIDVEIGRYDWPVFGCGCGRTAAHLADIRLADDLEAAQLATATNVLGLARIVLDDPASPYTEVRYAGLRLAECLRDAPRGAESRGLRLPAPDTEDAEGVIEDAEGVIEEEARRSVRFPASAELTHL